MSLYPSTVTLNRSQATSYSAGGSRSVEQRDDRSLSDPAITGTQPTADKDALAISATELRRARLSEYKRLWIIFDEHNLDILEHSFFFKQTAQVGSFSKAFIKVIAKRFMSAYQSDSGYGGVNRRE